MAFLMTQHGTMLYLRSLDHDVKEDRPWRESSDFKATFAAVWRNASLYIAVELTDDQIETAHEKINSTRPPRNLYRYRTIRANRANYIVTHFPLEQDIMVAGNQGLLVNWGHGGQSVELSFDLMQTPRKRGCHQFWHLLLRRRQ